MPRIETRADALAAELQDWRVPTEQRAQAGAIIDGLYPSTPRFWSDSEIQTVSNGVWFLQNQTQGTKVLRLSNGSDFEVQRVAAIGTPNSDGTVTLGDNTGGKIRLGHTWPAGFVVPATGATGPLRTRPSSALWAWAAGGLGAPRSIALRARVATGRRWHDAILLHVPGRNDERPPGVREAFRAVTLLDRVEECPAASYSPTPSPGQYHRR